MFQRLHGGVPRVQRRSTRSKARELQCAALEDAGRDQGTRHGPEATGRTRPPTRSMRFW